MKVLVCGGAGYIGSNMTALLAREGHEPVVLDNLSKGHRTAVRNVPFVEGDFGDFEFTRALLQKFNIDLCKAHLLALKKLDTESERVYNLGNGTGYSVRKVIDTVRKVTGKDFKVVETDRRPGDPPFLTADSSKAREELGWETDFSELEPIVESAWKFHTDYPDGYKD